MNNGQRKPLGAHRGIHVSAYNQEKEKADEAHIII